MPIQIPIKPSLKPKLVKSVSPYDSNDIVYRLILDVKTMGDAIDASDIANSIHKALRGSE